jgi:hypothetical protein
MLNFVFHHMQLNVLRNVSSWLKSYSFTRQAARQAEGAITRSPGVVATQQLALRWQTGRGDSDDSSKPQRMPDLHCSR